MELAVRGIDPALQCVALCIDKRVDTAKGVRLAVPGSLLEALVPDIGVGFAKADEEPGLVNEVGNEEFLFGGGGLVASDVIVAQGFESVPVFADEDVGIGEDGVLEGVEAGDGFAFGGAGSGGMLGVASIGCDLFWSCHMSPRLGGYPVYKVAGEG